MRKPVKARKKKRGNTPEGQVLRAVRDFLDLYGVWYFRQQQGLGSPPGVSDLLGCYRGRMLAIETKAPGKRVKPDSDQEGFLQNVHDQGGIAIECDSVEKLVEGFRRYGHDFNVLF